MVIRNLDDNQAVIAMVDSNLQREHLKPSEKAFAYKMKLEAMKRQGARTDLTSSQVGKKLSSSQNVTETSDQVGKKLTSSQVVTGTSDQAPPKLDNLTAKVYSLKSEHDANGNWKVGQGNVIATGVRADELLAKQVGENRMTIQRYIRLTNLIPKLLDMVDEGKIAFTIAVELSYLTEEEQYELL